MDVIAYIYILQIDHCIYVYSISTIDTACIHYYEVYLFYKQDCHRVSLPHLHGELLQRLLHPGLRHVALGARRVQRLLQLLECHLPTARHVDALEDLQRLALTELHTLQLCLQQAAELLQVQPLVLLSKWWTKAGQKPLTTTTKSLLRKLQRA